MRVRRHTTRAAIAQRPIVDFTTPTMRPQRRRPTLWRSLATTISTAFSRSVG